MPCPMRRFIPELRGAYAPGNKRGRTPGRTLVHQKAATKPIAATLRNRNPLATKDVWQEMAGSWLVGLVLAWELIS